MSLYTSLNSNISSHALIGVKIRRIDDLASDAINALDWKDIIDTLPLVRDVDWLQQMDKVCQSLISARTASYAFVVRIVKETASWIAGFFELLKSFFKNTVPSVLATAIDEIASFLGGPIGEFFLNVSRIFLPLIYNIINALRKVIIKAFEYAVSIFYGSCINIQKESQNKSVTKYLENYSFFVLGYLHERMLAKDSAFDDAFRKQVSINIQWLAELIKKNIPQTFDLKHSYFGERFLQLVAPIANVFTWLFEKAVKFIAAVLKYFSSCIDQFIECCVLLTPIASMSLQPLFDIMSKRRLPIDLPNLVVDSSLIDEVTVDEITTALYNLDTPLAQEGLIVLQNAKKILQASETKEPEASLDKCMDFARLMADFNVAYATKDPQDMENMIDDLSRVTSKYQVANRDLILEQYRAAIRYASMCVVESLFTQTMRINIRNNVTDMLAATPHDLEEKVKKASLEDLSKVADRIVTDMNSIVKAIQTSVLATRENDSIIKVKEMYEKIRTAAKEQLNLYRNVSRGKTIDRVTENVAIRLHGLFETEHLQLSRFQVLYALITRFEIVMNEIEKRDTTARWVRNGLIFGGLALGAYLLFFSDFITSHFYGVSQSFVPPTGPLDEFNMANTTPLPMPETIVENLPPADVNFADLIIQGLHDTIDQGTQLYRGANTVYARLKGSTRIIDDLNLFETGSKRIKDLLYGIGFDIPFAAYSFIQYLPFGYSLLQIHLYFGYFIYLSAVALSTNAVRILANFIPPLRSYDYYSEYHDSGTLRAIKSINAIAAYAGPVFLKLVASKVYELHWWADTALNFGMYAGGATLTALGTIVTGGPLAIFPIIAGGFAGLPGALTSANGQMLQFANRIQNMRFQGIMDVPTETLEGIYGKTPTDASRFLRYKGYNPDRMYDDMFENEIIQMIETRWGPNGLFLEQLRNPAIRANQAAVLRRIEQPPPTGQPHETALEKIRRLAAAERAKKTQ